MIAGRVKISKGVDMSLDDIVRRIVDAAMKCMAKLFAMVP
jgi:hypothetical protein